MDVELKALGLEARVCDILRGCGAMERAIISSFDWDQLKIVAPQEAPRCALRAARREGLRPRCWRRRRPDARVRDRAAVRYRGCRVYVPRRIGRGLAVYVWTARRRDDDAPADRGRR